MGGKQRLQRVHLNAKVVVNMHSVAVQSLVTRTPAAHHSLQSLNFRLHLVFDSPFSFPFDSPV